MADEKPTGHEFGTIVRQAFPPGKAVTSELDAAVSPMTKTQGLSLIRRDYDTAFHLLNRASEAMPALVRQCQVLEAEILYTRSLAEADLVAAMDEKSRWQQLAVVLKNRLDTSDRDRAELRERLAAAEAEAEAERQLVDAAEHKARLAIGITTLFHDKIIESFGIGSQAHAALDALVRDALHDSDPDKRLARRD